VNLAAGRTIRTDDVRVSPEGSEVRHRGRHRNHGMLGRARSGEILVIEAAFRGRDFGIARD
jgi:hypothetical protein